MLCWPFIWKLEKEMDQHLQNAESKLFSSQNSKPSQVTNQTDKIKTLRHMLKDFRFTFHVPYRFQNPVNNVSHQMRE